MILFPAIDLKNGQCVRLEKGLMERATIYHDDPVEQAQLFERSGFDWLHIVDLDGAVGGNSDNKTIIAEILKISKLKIQIGGGIRTMPHICFWLEKGAARIILGTLALSDPQTAKQACRDFPNQIIIALDGRNGAVAVEGWQNVSAESVMDAAQRISDWGAAAILYTDISRDGMMAGLNIKATIALSQSCDVPVIASGGLRGIEDIEALLAGARTAPQIDGGIEGVIAGRALYDGRLNPQQALALLAEA